MILAGLSDWALQRLECVRYDWGSGEPGAGAMLRWQALLLSWSWRLRSGRRCATAPTGAAVLRGTGIACRLKVLHWVLMCLWPARCVRLCFQYGRSVECVWYGGAGGLMVCYRHVGDV